MLDSNKNTTGKEPNESDKERVDRELIELLNELRVALPGIQVLFAFLLTVPFSQRFGQMNTGQRSAFFVAFLCTAISSILLIAPTLLHRLNFRTGDKEEILFISNRLMIIGTLFLAGAMNAAVYLIADVMYGGPQSVVVGVVIGVFLLSIWYALPLSRRRANGG
jgi:predicted neutral ceramidase superfamily lipid hydrolase